MASFRCWVFRCWVPRRDVELSTDVVDAGKPGGAFVVVVAVTLALTAWNAADAKATVAGRDIACAAATAATTGGDANVDATRSFAAPSMAEPVRDHRFSNLSPSHWGPPR